jgi:hypothetical protein
MGTYDDFFNDIDDVEPLPSNPNEDVFKALVERALKGKQSDFEFLRSLNDRYAASVYQNGVNSTVKIFRNLYASTMKNYLNQVKTNSQDLQTLLALKQFRQCLDFYTVELQIIKELIQEYRAYIFSGHLLEALSGIERHDEDLWDHRRKKRNGK